MTAPVPAPALPPPAVVAGPPIAINPLSQPAQARGGASIRRSARSTAAHRHQSKVTTRKTRSSAATTQIAPSASLPHPPPPTALVNVAAPVASASTATIVPDDDELAEALNLTAAVENPPPSPAVSDFDPPSLAEIEAFRAGDGTLAIFPPHALSEISDFDPPTASEIAARRAGAGGPITSLYPPGSFATSKHGEEEEDDEEKEDEEVIDLTPAEEAPPSRTLRSGVRGGRVAKPQAKGEGKGKKGKAKGKQPAKALPKPKKSLEYQLNKLRTLEWDVEESEWADDWANIVG
jgi:hypothetical protein